MDAIKRFGLYVLRSHYHAGIIALVCALAPVVGIPIIGWLSVIIVSLVTLRKGAGPGFLVLIWAAVPAIVVAFLGAPMFLLSQVILGSLVVWFFSLLLRNNYTWSQMLEIAAWVSVVIVLIVHGVIGDPYTWWTAKINGFLSQVSAATGEDMSAAMSPQQLYYIVHLATGFVASVVVLNSVFILLVGRWWQAVIYNPGGLKKEFLDIRLSYWMAGALVLSAILVSMQFEWAWDLLPVFCMVFFIAGFSLVNAWVLRLKHGWIWLIVFYILLVLRLLYIGAAVVVFAFVDSLVDFRKRWFINNSKG